MSNAQFNLPLTSEIAARLTSLGFAASGKTIEIHYTKEPILGIYIKSNRARRPALFSEHTGGIALSAGLDLETGLDLPRALAKAIAETEVVVERKLLARMNATRTASEWLASRTAFAGHLRTAGLTVDWSASSDYFTATNAVGTKCQFEAVRDSNQRVSYLKVSEIKIAVLHTALEDKAAVVVKFLNCLPWFA